MSSNSAQQAEIDRINKILDSRGYRISLIDPANGICKMVHLAHGNTVRVVTLADLSAEVA